MLAIERELGAAVLLHGEQGRPEPLLVVARLTVGASEAPAMHVSVAVDALIKLQTTISLDSRELGRVATLARHILMHALEGKGGAGMGAKPDLFRQPRPTNASVTILTSISELRFVHLRVARHAIRACAGRFDVAFVVTGLALRLRVAPGEAQDGMILLDVGDFDPVGLVVA
jgi:hypothetical protein